MKSKPTIIASLSGFALIMIGGCALMDVAVPAKFQPATSPAPATSLPQTPAVIVEEPTTAFLTPTLTPGETSEPTPLAPTTAPSETAAQATPESPLLIYFFTGGTFSYDPAIASGVEEETVEAQSGADLPYWEQLPQHVRLTFVDYALSGAFHQPQIFIYPVADYLAIQPDLERGLAELQRLLQEKPADAPQEDLPFFTIWNAAQVFHTQLKYLDFKSGSGLRYLTQYGQDVYPINNQSLFYTFQGVTNDGQWLVSAVLPVAHPILPHPDSVLAEQGFYDRYQDYLEETSQLLAAQPDSSFQPDLSRLDALFQSLELQ